MCFKQENNVCTCAVSALILLPVVILSGNGFSNINFLYDVEILTIECCFLSIFQFFTAHVQFQRYYNLRFKILRHV